MNPSLTTHLRLTAGYRYRRATDELYHRVARLMPRRLRYWATIVSGAEATTGRYGATVVTEIRYVDVLQRIEVGSKPRYVELAA